MSFSAHMFSLTDMINECQTYIYFIQNSYFKSAFRQYSLNTSRPNPGKRYVQSIRKRIGQRVMQAYELA
jgi:hypothetical protein